ncbi:MAG: di-trans,poly-cis-decaprenylcistransferase [Planctomyces sp.]|nr:di-trans,poly-cis-decaprenylcistransferase [Planctomyces sp.]
MGTPVIAPDAASLTAARTAPPPLPRHVAVIMDGNGRWAQRQGLERIEGHRRGVQSVRCVVEECVRLGIEQLTLYCLSSENWKRPQTELDFLMSLLKEFLIAERPEIIRQNLRFSVIGRRTELPQDVLDEIDTTAATAASHTGMRLCLAINYGSRAEIVDAVRSLARDVAAGRLTPEAIDEDLISARLDTGGMPEPDLVIRTAGEMRLSNFLLWQISYAELFVTPTFWPEFREVELHAALEAFARRQRRFGGLHQPAVNS